MSILTRKSKVEVHDEGQLTAIRALKQELKNLQKRLLDMEGELERTNESITTRSWNIEHLQDHKRQALQKSAIENLTERRDDIIDQIEGLNRDIRTISISLKAAEREAGQARAESGEGEIVSKLAALVEKAEQTIQLNQEYYEIRKRFEPYTGHDWPYSNSSFDLYKHKGWIREAKKYLSKKEKI
jgi:predicted  nucleic acid-binding Zn-ribbon protein